MSTLNLFALTNDPARRILRIPLSGGVQQEISQEFLRQENSFDALTQAELVFDGKYKPEAGESLIIRDYDDIDSLHGAIANPLSIPEVRADADEFACVKALFSGYDKAGKKVALIQGFDRRRIISRAGISLYHSNNVYKKVDGVGLSLDVRLAATLVDDTLKFVSFHNARQIFDLSQYYIEATDNDLTDFAAIPALEIKDKATFLLSADSWVRRKVALIQQSRILEIVPMDVIKDVASSFGITITISSVNGVEAISLPDKKADLKMILRFLDEDYYRSSLSSTNYITNSKRLA